MSDNMINVSAFVIWATLADNLSLSPYLISEVAVVSFSLTIGIAFKFKIFCIVSLAFKALRLFSVSSSVRRICPIFNFFFLKAFLNKFISSIWPIAATAWNSLSFKFLRLIFKNLQPRAMAPLVTIIISVLFFLSFNTSSASLLTHWILTLLFLIKSDEPIFTIVLFDL